MSTEVWREAPRGLRPCKACAAPLGFVYAGVDERGKKKWLPLDLRTIREKGTNEQGFLVYEARSHYQTCPKASEFSGGRRES